MTAVLHLRSGSGWTSRRHDDPDEVLDVPVVGLTCRLRDVYARTPLLRSGP